MNDKRYIPETLFDELGFRMSFAAEKIVFQGQGDLQSLVLFENKRFGRMLMLDGATQVTTADEFIYSEMMSHVPILAHGQCEDVLIIGGGDCLIAEEVLKHKGVKRCVQVEIDKAVLDFSKEYFLEWNRPFFEDKRVESVIADGMHYVADRKNHGRFDVIIVDSTDPQGPGAVLFSREFYEGAKHCLKPGGVMVTQNGVPFFQPEELARNDRHLARHVRRPLCLCGRHPDLCRWAHDHGFCDAGQGVARRCRFRPWKSASPRRSSRRAITRPRCTRRRSHCRASFAISSRRRSGRRG